MFPPTVVTWAVPRSIEREGECVCVSVRANDDGGGGCVHRFALGLDVQLTLNPTMLCCNGKWRLIQ